MTVFKIILGAVAYFIVMVLYGIMGPSTDIETGQNKQHWWEAPLWPLGLLYRMMGGL